MLENAEKQNRKKAKIDQFGYLLASLRGLAKTWFYVLRKVLLSMWIIQR